MSFCEAIRDVTAKLHDNGLTAFDINNIESVKISRRLAVKACVETTLNLLTKSLSDKIKILLLWTGIGTSLQTAVLCNLWNISKQDAETTVDTLWNYGLVQFTNVKMYLNSIIAHRCVEVHVVISHYIIDSIESKEVDALSPFVGSVHTSVRQGLMLLVEQSFRVPNVPLSQIKEHYLEYRLNEIQNFTLPYYLKLINMHVITNPHMIKLTLHRIRECLMNSSYTLQLHMLSLGDQFNLLTTECKEILKGAHKVRRKLNQDVQKYLVGNNYVALIQTVENFCKSYRLGSVAQRAVTMTKKILPYCEGEELFYMTFWCEDMYTMATDYHAINTLILPLIKLLTKILQQIMTSLEKGSASIESMYHYLTSGKAEEEGELLWNNYLINLQEVSPQLVLRMLSEQ